MVKDLRRCYLEAVGCLIVLQLSIERFDVEQLSELAVAISRNPVGRCEHVAAGGLGSCSFSALERSASNLQMGAAGDGHNPGIPSSFQDRRKELCQQVMAQEISGEATVEALFGNKRCLWSG